MWQGADLDADKWLCSLQTNRVEFGLLSAEDMARSPDGRKTRLKMAVPFRGKDTPSEASEFAHPDITVGVARGGQGCCHGGPGLWCCGPGVCA